jgi:poly-beta-1,6-N-acetyl-D-glucosamine synthase
MRRRRPDNVRPVTPRGLRYALVTPARNEAENLRRLADSVTSQRVLPASWIVVDDGSSDGTRAVAEALARVHAWIRVADSPAVAQQGLLEDGRTRGRDVVAFNTGVDAIRDEVDVVVKLDADVSVGPDFFERLLGEFAADSRLGIASGTCYEEEDGRWIARHVARSHVRGATRAWRRACFREIQPLEERLGWDIVDELKANLRGWRTRPVLDLPFYHHRAVGQRDGRRRAWAEQGVTAHYVGYRPSYVVARALHWARRDPAALAMVWGYLSSLAARRPRHPDSEIRKHLRSTQRLRNLPLRARELSGRSV